MIIDVTFRHSTSDIHLETNSTDEDRGKEEEAHCYYFSKEVIQVNKQGNVRHSQ